MDLDAEHRRLVICPDPRLTALTGARSPIVQAPMAGAGGVALAIAAIRGGALGSLPCALLTPDGVQAQVAEVREVCGGPINLNFFCHKLPPAPDESEWRAALARFYAEEGVEPGNPPVLRRPFDAAMCDLVETVRPEVVSFHFGLPDAALLNRVRGSGARVFGNATTAAEAKWLAERDCDAIIAQGAEAGGHAGWFLQAHDPHPLARLLPAVLQVTDLPVVAAGGIVDAGDVTRVMNAGAAGVQVGTAYLATPESSITASYRTLLGTAVARTATFTNVMTGREARGIVNRLMHELGPMSDLPPVFPYAANALAPLRAKAEAEGRVDYTPLWVGKGADRVTAIGAEQLTRTLADGLGSAGE